MDYHHPTGSSPPGFQEDSPETVSSGSGQIVITQQPRKVRAIVHDINARTLPRPAAPARLTRGMPRGMACRDMSSRPASSQDDVRLIADEYQIPEGEDVEEVTLVLDEYARVARPSAGNPAEAGPEVIAIGTPPEDELTAGNPAGAALTERNLGVLSAAPNSSGSTRTKLLMFEVEVEEEVARERAERDELRESEVVAARRAACEQRQVAIAELHARMAMAEAEGSRGGTSVASSREQRMAVRWEDERLRQNMARLQMSIQAPSVELDADQAEERTPSTDEVLPAAQPSSRPRPSAAEAASEPVETPVTSNDETALDWIAIELQGIGGSEDVDEQLEPVPKAAPSVAPTILEEPPAPEGPVVPTARPPSPARYVASVNANVYVAEPDGEPPMESERSISRGPHRRRSHGPPVPGTSQRGLTGFSGPDRYVIGTPRNRRHARGGPPNEELSDDSPQEDEGRLVGARERNRSGNPRTRAQSKVFAGRPRPKSPPGPTGFTRSTPKPSARSEYHASEYRATGHVYTPATRAKEGTMATPLSQRSQVQQFVTAKHSHRRSPDEDVVNTNAAPDPGIRGEWAVDQDDQTHVFVDHADRTVHHVPGTEALRERLGWTRLWNQAKAVPSRVYNHATRFRDLFGYPNERDHPRPNELVTVPSRTPPPEWEAPEHEEHQESQTRDRY